MGDFKWKHGMEHLLQKSETSNDITNREERTINAEKSLTCCQYFTISHASLRFTARVAFVLSIAIPS